MGGDDDQRPEISAPLAEAPGRPRQEDPRGDRTEADEYAHAAPVPYRYRVLGRRGPEAVFCVK